MTDPWLNERASQLHEDAFGWWPAVQTVGLAVAVTVATLIRSAWQRVGRIR